MKLLHEVCSLPTAPFVEDRVAAYAREFAKARSLKVTKDSSGNLLLELRGRKRGAPRWVFTAHMDHPGLVSRRMLDARTVQADFRGWVLADYLKGQRMRFITSGGADIPATILDVKPEKGGTRADQVTLRVKSPVPPNSPGMFDQGMARVKRGKFYSRAIDDLGGLAAALQMLDQLHKAPPPSTIAVLLTRAEEDGFIGAIAACLRPQLLRKSDYLIAIETSAEQPFARQGNGCIIRIGDRTSVFNSGLSYFITYVAARVAKKDKQFKYQRALMPGGTCEATVYDVYGYHAGSICVPLGNYHNMDREKKRIGPEYIDVSDWQNMVKLFVAVAKQGHAYERGHAMLKEKLEKRFGKLKRLL
jgi:endoglucanase